MGWSQIFELRSHMLQPRKKRDVVCEECIQSELNSNIGVYLVGKRKTYLTDGSFLSRKGILLGPFTALVNYVFTYKDADLSFLARVGVGSEIAES